MKKTSMGKKRAILAEPTEAAEQARISKTSIEPERAREVKQPDAG
jgi:hypothetical protein